MTDIDRERLYGRLSKLLDLTLLDEAWAAARRRGNPNIELCHWLHRIVVQPDSDVARLLRHLDVALDRVTDDTAAAMEKLPRGATAVGDLASHVDLAIQQAWLVASIEFDSSRIRSGHLLLALIRDAALRNVTLAISPELRRLKPDALATAMAQALEGSPEEPAPAERPGAAATPTAAAAGQGALARFATDLTASARDGRIDPVTGRDDEIRQLVDILMRRRQNNPILTGEAGVGKTAVVEGLARRIVAGDVPPALRAVRLMSVDIGLLQAGASMKGEFENRLRQLIEEVEKSPEPIILFVDEAHTLIGAGGQAGTGDAANLLKPALARGTLRTVAATTWAEYKRFFEKDPALTRRFQVVQVREPEEAVAVAMLRAVAPALERHHGVTIVDRALAAAVRLSHRYIPSRQLPDKAVSLLDTACARVAVSQHAVPPALEDARARLERLQTEMRIVERDGSIGAGTLDPKAALEAALDAEQARITALEARWASERSAVERLIATQRRILEAGRDDDTVRSAQPELEAHRATLAELQGAEPLVHPLVGEEAVAAVVADWTGIPVGTMVKDEIEAVLALADTLSERVVGQSHGLEMIARRIQTARAGLDNPSKPIGVFLLAGPSGVGKTETALALAQALYGGESNVVTINMSEYQEAHTVSTLKGAPPGYVGYGEGGVLTEAVRRRPYSVVLLDEVEKAHPDVHEVFFQVFDKGWMEDGEGRFVDFRNTIILLTSNVGSEVVMRMCQDEDARPAPEELATALRPALLDVFPAALLGRIVVVPYYPLSRPMMDRIIRLQLDRIVERVRKNHGVALHYDEAVVRLVASRCSEIESGGRMIDSILTNTILPGISREFLRRLGNREPLGAVTLGATGQEFTFAFEG